ncbi:hypothetical protein N9J83_07700 [Opitutales bacterium]|nr:hypothetical protein [Opitutales bacterium]
MKKAGYTMPNLVGCILLRVKMEAFGCGLASKVGYGQRQIFGPTSIKMKLQIGYTS